MSRREKMLVTHGMIVIEKRVMRGGWILKVYLTGFVDTLEVGYKKN